MLLGSRFHKDKSVERIEWVALISVSASSSIFRSGPVRRVAVFLETDFLFMG